MKKKTMALLLTICMIFSVIPVFSASAAIVESGTCGATVNYNLYDDGHMIISGNGPMTDYSLNSDSPFSTYSTINKVTISSGVTSIGDYSFNGCNTITSIEFEKESTVRTIGTNAFSGCSLIETIDLPDSLITIKNAAFDLCGSLTTINIPATLENIGEYVFFACNNLRYINVDPLNNYFCAEDGILFPKDKSYIIKYSAKKTDKTYIIPETVKGIGVLAFECCNSLENIVFPSELTAIEFGAFMSCDSLKNVVLHNGLYYISDSAFSGCSNLTSVELPNSLTYISNTAFDLCPVTIYACQNTVAEEYCINNGINFSSLFTPEKINAKEATCTAEGNIEYYRCKRCGNLYLDAYGTIPINIEETKTQKIPHTEVILQGKAATCTETGLTEGKKCSVCNKILVAQKVIAKINHTPDKPVTENMHDSTCTKAGYYDEVIYCSMCKTELSRRNIEIPIKEHSIEILPAVPATCTSTGLTEGKKCSVCGKILEKQEITDKLPHIPAEPIKENIVESTCIASGYYDNVVYCSKCNTELSRKTIILPLAEHTEIIIPSVAPTCTSVGYTEGIKCSVCNKVIIEPEIIGKTEHIDKNGDGICDICNEEFKTPCNHMCHSKNKLIRFIWNIINFFNKLFKINQFCECGARHW